ATGFLRAGPRVAFREKDNPERRYEYLDDLIDTTSRGVLGLTVRCARCHNHKFDPIPQHDYYSLIATFFGYVETNYPLVPRAEAARRNALADQVAALEKTKPAPVAEAEIVTDGDYRFAPDGDGDEVIGCPKCRIPDVPSGSFLHEGPGPYQTPPSYFLLRGDPGSKGPLMKPGFVTVATYGNPPTEIPPADGRTSGRRRALAEWLASVQNPLTARVIVNRIWHHHFGRGIVATLDNFGKMGEPPTHPELLDYLAVEFMNRGWSIKQMHRLIMTSEAYQMASAYEDPADSERDPQNQYLWRFRAQRLAAEI